MNIEFTKTVSHGNDFLHISLEGRGFSHSEKSALAGRICDRKTGVGADGVVYYRVNADAIDFQIFNRDGSEAELSGNGMAGLAAVLFDGEEIGNLLTLHTAAGEKTIRCKERGGGDFRLQVEIGSADFANQDHFPFLEMGRWEYRLQEIPFYPVSVGNPHAVVISSSIPPAAESRRLAERLVSASIFPRGVNVEVVGSEKNGCWPVYFHERGVGRTESSSTGSAAVHAVLRKLNRVIEETRIGAPGREIRVSGHDVIRVENFTRIVYSGVYSL